MDALPRWLGPYELLQELGSGAMGQVFLARPAAELTGLPPLVVVKTLRAELSAEPSFVRRFRHEARIATVLASPYLATVFDAGRQGEVLYIAMEYVAGWPLSRVLRALSEARLFPSIASAVDLAADLLAALAAVHGARDLEGQPLGAIHRDVAPKNAILGEDGRVRLIDFGVGRSRLKDWQTRAGAVVGSLGYMAPEQVTAAEVDHRADLYAVGVILFELLTLVPYVAPASVQDMLYATARPHPRDLLAVRPEAPPALARVLDRALALSPSGRFSSAEEMLAELRQAVPVEPRRDSAHTLVGSLRLGALEPTRAESLAEQLRASPRPPRAAEQRTEVIARRAAVDTRPAPPSRSRASLLATLDGGRSGWALRLSSALAVVLLSISLGMYLERSRRPAPELPAPAPPRAQATPRPPYATGEPAPAEPRPAAHADLTQGTGRRPPPAARPTDLSQRPAALTPAASPAPAALGEITERVLAERRRRAAAGLGSETLDALLAELQELRATPQAEEPARVAALARRVERLLAESPPAGGQASARGR